MNNGGSGVQIGETLAKAAAGLGRDEAWRLGYGVSGLAGSIDLRSSSIVRPAKISCRSVE